MRWLYKTGQVLNYLALALYLGGLVALGAVAAPAIFRTLEGAGIVAARSMPAGSDLGRQLGGETFGNVLRGFVPVEIGCLVTLTVASVLLAAGGAKLTKMAVARLVLLAVVLGLAGYDYTLVWPKIWTERAAWRQSLDAGQVVQARAHQATFDALHARSETVAQAKVWLLLGLLIVSVLAEQGPGAGERNSDDGASPAAVGRKGPQWRMGRGETHRGT